MKTGYLLVCYVSDLIITLNQYQAHKKNTNSIVSDYLSWKTTPIFYKAKSTLPNRA